MVPGSFQQLDFRKWFDRMLPQTLQVAQWLLYIDGAFAVLGYLDRTDQYGMWRYYGGIGGILAPLACLAFIAGGFLIANGRRLLRALYKFEHAHALTLRWVITQDNLISFLFEAALVALLLHPMSRSYATRWLR